MRNDVTDEALRLTRELAAQAGMDTMTEETWGMDANQLWSDLEYSLWQNWPGGNDLTMIDCANAAAAGDIAGLVRLRDYFGLRP